MRLDTLTLAYVNNHIAEEIKWMRSLAAAFPSKDIPDQFANEQKRLLKLQHWLTQQMHNELLNPKQPADKPLIAVDSLLEMNTTKDPDGKSPEEIAAAAEYRMEDR